VAKAQALDILERCLADNTNAWVLDSTGTWSRLDPEGGEPRNAQLELRDQHLALAATTAPQVVG